MSYKIEKDWVSKTGYRCVAIAIDVGHRCGYVGITPTHPLYGAEYNEPSEALSHLSEEKEHEEIGKRSPVTVFCAAGDDNPLTRPDIFFDVHGSLTFSKSGNSGYPVSSFTTFWYGFDCAHLGDAKDPSIMEAAALELEERYPSSWDEGTIRTLEYVIEECESLAAQLKHVEEEAGR